MMVLEMVGQMQSLQPIDPGLVARELWKPDFVATISQKLADDKADRNGTRQRLWPPCRRSRPARS